MNNSSESHSESEHDSPSYTSLRPRSNVESPVRTPQPSSHTSNHSSSLSKPIQPARKEPETISDIRKSLAESLSKLGPMEELAADTERVKVLIDASEANSRQFKQWMDSRPASRARTPVGDRSVVGVSTTGRSPLVVSETVTIPASATKPQILTVAAASKVVMIGKAVQSERQPQFSAACQTSKRRYKVCPGVGSFSTNSSTPTSVTVGTMTNEPKRPSVTIVREYEQPSLPVEPVAPSRRELSVEPLYEEAKKKKSPIKEPETAYDPTPHKKVRVPEPEIYDPDIVDYIVTKPPKPKPSMKAAPPPMPSRQESPVKPPPASSKSPPKRQPAESEEDQPVMRTPAKKTPKKQIDSPPIEEPEESLHLLECPNCSRKFSSEVFEKHQNICTTMNSKSRKVFDSKARRLAGLKAENGKPLAAIPHHNDQEGGVKTNWRQKSNQLRAAIGSSLTQDPEAKAAYAAELQKYHMLTNKQCVVCGRCFNDASYPRHLEMCMKFVEKANQIDCSTRQKTGAERLAERKAQEAADEAKLQKMRQKRTKLPTLNPTRPSPQKSNDKSRGMNGVYATNYSTMRK